MSIEKEHLLSFTDGRGSFSFQVQISENIRQDTSTGYLYCDNAIFGRTGVQEYYAHELGMGKNEIIKVHRFPEDVFSDSAMASYEGKSITVYHPAGKKVTSRNYKDLDVGTILKVWKDGELVKGNIVIKDADLIMDILDGIIKELSLGYQASFLPIGNGEYKQADFIINHLAIVKKGRAQVAQIVDEDSIKKEKSFMGLFSFLKGKKLKINDDDTVTVVEDEVEEEKDKTKEKKVPQVGLDAEKVIVEEVITPIVVDEKPVVTEVILETTTKKVDEVQEKKEIQDMDKEELKVFLADLKAEMLKEIKAELATKELTVTDSVFDKTKVVVVEDEKKVELKLDFERDEKLRKLFWDKYTNPMAHGGSFKDLNAFKKQADNIIVR